MGRKLSKGSAGCLSCWNPLSSPEVFLQELSEGLGPLALRKQPLMSWDCLGTRSGLFCITAMSGHRQVSQRGVGEGASNSWSCKWQRGLVARERHGAVSCPASLLAKLPSCVWRDAVTHLLVSSRISRDADSLLEWPDHSKPPDAPVMPFIPGAPCHPRVPFLFPRGSLSNFLSLINTRTGFHLWHVP